MGPFKVYICHGSDPKNNPSAVHIGRLLEKLGTDYRSFPGSRRRWTVLSSSHNIANSMVVCIGIKENKLVAFIPARVVVKKGIIRGIPLDISNEELLERLRTKNLSLHVTGAKRLQMLQKNVPA
jgi:hypothetical protein